MLSVDHKIQPFISHKGRNITRILVKYIQKSKTLFININMPKMKVLFININNTQCRPVHDKIIDNMKSKLKEIKVLLIHSSNTQCGP